MTTKSYNNNISGFSIMSKNSGLFLEQTFFCEINLGSLAMNFCEQERQSNPNRNPKFCPNRMNG